MMKRVGLDQKFWRKFAQSYWEKRPFTIYDFQSPLLALNDEEIFRLLVEAAERARKERRTLGFKFYVNGLRSSKVETLHVLPRPIDKSLRGFHERMERVYQDYCLVCDELFEIDSVERNPIQDFLRDLYKHVRSKKKFIEIGLYLGNYKKTPFGVHVDDCGVFSFPVVGKKKFRTWTSAYVKKHPELEQSFRYSKHKAKSKLLEVKVGDMAYWPSSSWHIAESDGKFSATWSIGVWLKPPPSDGGTI
jgi:hypothetical protein